MGYPFACLPRWLLAIFLHGRPLAGHVYQQSLASYQTTDARELVEGALRSPSCVPLDGYSPEEILTGQCSGFCQPDTQYFFRNKTASKPTRATGRF